MQLQFRVDFWAAFETPVAGTFGEIEDCRYWLKSTDMILFVFLLFFFYWVAFKDREANHIYTDFLSVLKILRFGAKEVVNLKILCKYVLVARKFRKNSKTQYPRKIWENSFLDFLVANPKCKKMKLSSLASINCQHRKDGTGLKPFTDSIRWKHKKRLSVTRCTRQALRDLACTSFQAINHETRNIWLVGLW